MQFSKMKTKTKYNWNKEKEERLCSFSKLMRQERERWYYILLVFCPYDMLLTHENLLKRELFLQDVGPVSIIRQLHDMKSQKSMSISHVMHVKLVLFL